MWSLLPPLPSMIEMLSANTGILRECWIVQSSAGPHMPPLTASDIKSKDGVPFGGINVVFGGDFQQILPVVKKGWREQIVENKCSGSGTAEDREYAKWLLDIGQGSINGPENTINLEPAMKCGDTVDSLTHAIYPGLNLIQPNNNNDEWFLERTILCAKNDAVDGLNLLCLSGMQGNLQVYHSADEAIPDGAAQDKDFQYPVEYLNSINGSGLPVSRLHLKLGCPIQ
ncbi:hypothetical protein D9757_003219 [Collybiopsis confluens]|uniref:ATP-dependent DNA helicase n=1 Tax=Collybiopsis confluens TaxID=2823264 RepID=A0A8H5MEZ5_9AGAR|nr:hypothetical protein D9757_003219 [Collybiopsis confluens]